MRFPPWVRGLAVRLYVEGLSLRSVSRILCELGFNVSYEAVRKWFQIAGGYLSNIVRRGRGFIAMDETYLEPSQKGVSMGF